MSRHDTIAGSGHRKISSGTSSRRPTTSTTIAVSTQPESPRDGAGASSVSHETARGLLLGDEVDEPLHRLQQRHLEVGVGVDTCQHPPPALPRLAPAEGP